MSSAASARPPLLLDTHAAVWVAQGDPSLAGTARAALRAALSEGGGGGVLLSPVTAWEVGLLAQRGRLDLRPDPLAWFEALLARPRFGLAPLTPAIAVAASFLPDGLHQDPADRFLVATARALGAALVTRDAKILAYAEAGHVAAVAC